MSQIPHCSFHLNIDYWDYYILCRLNINAARILARMEYWNSTKVGGIPHAEAINDRLEEAGEVATQDTTRYVFKGEEELYWELMGSCGEKNIPHHLSFLVNDLNYLVSRRNPFKGFDRTKQYEFQDQLVKEHVSKLSAIVQVFLKAGRRPTPVQYAIEMLTAEGVYIDSLSVEVVAAKLSELHRQAQQDELNGKYEKGKKPAKALLPKFIRLALKKDEQNGFNAASPFRILPYSFPQNAETKEAKCGNDSAERRNGFRILPPAIPAITISNDESIITINKDTASDGTTFPTDERALAYANDALSLIASLLNLNVEEAGKVVEIAQNLRQRREVPVEENEAPSPVLPASESSLLSEETKHEASNQQNARQANEKERLKKCSRQAAKSEVVLTLQGQHIIDLYQQFKGRRILPTDETVNAANKLGEFVEHDENFLEVLQAIADDEFLKKKRVRWDLDYAYRKYDEYLDSVERKRGNEEKTNYIAVMGMTATQRAEYVQRQREQQQQEMPTEDRKTLMGLSPPDRIACLKLSPRERSTYLKNVRAKQAVATA
jgi:hypothetical protein